MIKTIISTSALVALVLPTFAHAEEASDAADRSDILVLGGFVAQIGRRAAVGL